MDNHTNFLIAFFVGGVAFLAMLVLKLPVKRLTQRVAAGRYPNSPLLAGRRFRRLNIMLIIMTFLIAIAAYAAMLNLFHEEHFKLCYALKGGCIATALYAVYEQLFRQPGPQTVKGDRTADTEPAEVRPGYEAQGTGPQTAYARQAADGRRRALTKTGRIMIDFHSHILPKADHGSGSVETSLAQLAAERDNGFDIVVATPHFYANAENVDNFLKRRSESYGELMKTLTAQGPAAGGFGSTADAAGVNFNAAGGAGVNSDTGDAAGCATWTQSGIPKGAVNIGGGAYPRILLGAEVLLFPNMDEMEGLEQLVCENTDYLLIEMPFTEWTRETFETLERLSMDERFNIILAHIERYEKRDLKRTERLNVKYQINGRILNTFTGRIRMKKYMESGRVVALGSDLHGSRPTQVENLVRAIERYDFEPKLPQITEKYL